MFGIDSGELLIIAVVALVVIGPKDLPNVMRTVGGWIARARGMASHFRSGIDTMIRETELEEMQKQWAADNERIMRDHPMAKPGAAPEPPRHSDVVAPPEGLASAAEDGARRPPPIPPRRPAPAAPSRAAPPAPPKGLP